MNTTPMHQPILEKKELFAFIRACKLQINDSLLQEFQEQGVMLPAAERRGRGRGKGSRGLWTLQQRDLLRELCKMRERYPIHSIAQRCNLIVWIWLYWGDEWGVTLEQIQRVMKTWANSQQRSSLKMAQQGARKMVHEVANQHDGGKQQAIRELTDLFYKGTYTSEDVSNSLHHVFTPKKAANGPCDIPITPEGVGVALSLKQEAVKTLVDGTIALPAVHWQWARHFHLLELGQYIPQQRGYAAAMTGSPVEQLFTIDTIETLLPHACTDLVMALGIGLRYPSPANMPDHLRLDFWKSRIKSATVLSQQEVSPILLPNGMRSAYLKIVENVTLLESEEGKK